MQRGLPEVMLESNPQFMDGLLLGDSSPMYQWDVPGCWVGGPISLVIWQWLSKPMVSHFGVGEFTTHFRTYFWGWIESDVCWGLTDLGFDPWPFDFESLQGSSKDTCCNHLRHVAFSTKIKGHHHLQVAMFRCFSLHPDPC